MWKFAAVLFILMLFFGNIRPLKLFKRAQSVNFVRRWTSTENDQFSSDCQTYNLKGFREEIGRQIYRSTKKVTKLLEKLEEFPDNEVLKDDLEASQSRLRSLNLLNENLSKVKSTNDSFLKSLLPDINLLELSDSPPTKQDR